MSENNTEPRKASEILLELEEKVDALKNSVGLYNFNLNLILGTVNKTYALLANLTNANVGAGMVQKPQLPPSAPSVPAVPDLTKISVPEGASVDVATEFLGKRRTERDNVSPGAPSLTPPASEIKSDRKVPVMQRIQDNNKRDVFMAEVQIYSSNNELVSKSKTSATGKYQAQLVPGRYTVKISKVDPTTKKKAEAIQEIDVVNSDTTIMLPTFFIQR